MITLDRPSAGGLKPWRLAMWASFVTFLVCPLVAMQFTSEVDWDRSDFAAAAILLVGLGVAIELASRWIGAPLWRGVVIAVAVITGAVIWADAAIGVF